MPRTYLLATSFIEGADHDVQFLDRGRHRESTNLVAGGGEVKDMRRNDTSRWLGYLLKEPQEAQGAGQMCRRFSPGDTKLICNE